MIEHLYYWIKSYSMRICGTGYHTIRPKAWKLCRRKPFSSEKVHNFKMSRVQKFYGNMEKWHFQKLTLYSERYTGRKDWLYYPSICTLCNRVLFGPSKSVEAEWSKKKIPLTGFSIHQKFDRYSQVIHFICIFCSNILYCRRNPLLLAMLATSQATFDSLQE